MIKKFFATALVALAALLPVPAAQAATCNQVACVTMHDTIPNFVAAPTVRSVQSGSWFNPSTWSSGAVPTPTDIVSIDSGTTVVINDTGAVAKVVGVQGSGTLKFQSDAVSILKVNTLFVLPNGTVNVGTKAEPITGSVEIVIANGAFDQVGDPRQFGNGIVVVDGTFTSEGLAKTRFVRTTAEPLGGAATLAVESPVVNWQVGDRLVLPDSKNFLNTLPTYTYEGEEAYVKAVSADGKTITLEAPLRFTHPGARSAADVLEFYPHVANISQNVVIRSESQSGLRGHTLFTELADVSIRNTAFVNLGRTTTSPLNNSVFDAQGNLIRFGTNHIGRYPLHIHHVYGKGNKSPNPQFVVEGNVVYDENPSNVYKWAITIHGSHYGLIKNNVVYNAAGWGIGTEDGSESFNEFSENFVVKVRGNGLRDSSEGAQAFWFRGPNNYVRNNVAANAWNAYAESAHGYLFQFQYLGNICVPKFPGADMNQCNTMNGNAMPILEFSGNEAYGAIDIGLSIWWLGTQGGYSDYPTPTTTLKDFRVWNYIRYGSYFYPMNAVVIDGYTARYRRQALGNTNDYSMGIFFSDYSATGTTMRNLDIQGNRTGVMTPFWARGITTIENSYLRNANNITVSTLGAPGALGTGYGLQPKTLMVRNVKFDAPLGSLGQTPFNIRMNYTTWNGFANLVQPDKVFVVNYNQVQGDDFQVFYNQQTPSFVMPQSTAKLAASPDAGLTNDQNWTKYSIAIAGEVATNTGSRSGIFGLVRPGINSVAPLPTFTSAPTIQQASLVVSDLVQRFDGQPKNVTVATVPAGLSGVSVTYNGGSLAPVLPGLYDVVITLSNGGYSAKSVLTQLYIQPDIAFGPPNIPVPTAYRLSAQPTSAVALAGATVTMEVAVNSPSPVTYQWQKNGRNITGATSATYTPPALVPTDSGSLFRVVVTNVGGQVVSAPLTLTVN